MPIFRFAWLVFAITSFAGPVLRLITWWLPSPFEDHALTGLASSVSELVYYLWPAQILALVDDGTTAGFIWAGVWSIGGNLVLFNCLGLVVGALAKWRPILPLFYATWCLLVLLWLYWIDGFSLSHIAWGPLMVAFVLYAIPFWIVWRAASQHAPPT
jgi:hypothetical protein